MLDILRKFLKNFLFNRALFDWLNEISSRSSRPQPKTVWACLIKIDGARISVYEYKKLWKSSGFLGIDINQGFVFGYFKRK